MAMPLRSSPEQEPDTDFWKREALDSIDRVASTYNEFGVESKAVTSVSADSLVGPYSSANIKSGSADEQRAALPHDVSTALTYGFDLVRYGAMLVAVGGRPQVANHTALAILDKKDGLCLTNGGLIADRASDTRLLIKLLQEAIQTPELGEPKESPLTLPRKTARTSLIVRVIPGPGLGCWPGKGNGAAMLMLYDQDMKLEVNLSILCRLYGLTRGEAVLAASLMRGKSLEEAAEELFISLHTARTHLKRIFMKTDTHRQTELVVRIFPAVL
jgi:DNA-binding CsgD family transcriptional regulator